MVLGWFKSYVKNEVPEKPIRFQRKSDGESKTFPEMMREEVESFQDGSSFVPMFPSGHMHTVLTAVNRFDGRDQVHYKRRVMSVDSKNKFYEVEGEKLKYDSWEGESTIAVDYVSHGPSDPEHERFKPESQHRRLPKRTEYMDPEKERDFLSDDSKPLVVVLHGLSGGSYENYIRAFLSKVTEDPYNFDALVLNSRGCANHTITTPQLFNGIWTNDLRYLMNEHIRVLWPNKRIYLIGFSLGGSILANYLGQESDDVYHNIKAATIVGCPWDFVDSSVYLNSSYIGSNVYSSTMCKNLLRLLDKHYDSHLKYNTIVDEYKKNPEKFNLTKLKDFDDVFTSRFFGFNCANEYYRTASPAQRLTNVRVPTLILNSEDDPIIGWRTLPKKEVELNPYTVMVTTTIGGHLGWFTYQGERWDTSPISKLFKAIDEKWDAQKPNREDLPTKLKDVWRHDRYIA